MPIYGFRCQKCGSTYEHYYAVRELKPTIACSDCGDICERDLTAEARNHVPASGFPFTTRHLNGQPIEVTSAAHLQQLCKQHGKTLRDDAGYIEQDMHIEKYIDRNGNLAVRPVYRSGSGDGEGKRRWI